MVQFISQFLVNTVLMSTTDEGEEQDVADQSEITEAVPMDTQPPPDPTKGLPQLFRSRRLSSDFSEDGESIGSRRNSISNGGPSRIPGSIDNGVIGTVDNRGTTITGKETLVAEDPVVTVQPKMLSSLAVQKVNVFDLAFSKKLSEKQDHQEQQPKQAQPGTSSQDAAASKTDEVPPTLAKPVKQEVPAAQPAQPVIFQKPQPPVAHSQTRVLPPPLKLMSPSSSEHPAANMPTQQPPLSPMTTRSPVQIMGMPRLPILSPLRTPTSANRHPMRIAGTFGHTAGSPSIMSPPTLRSPVDTISTSIEAHPNSSGFPGPSTVHVHVPRVHGTSAAMLPPPPPPPPPPHSIPFSAHPPSQPFTAEPLQAQPQVQPQAAVSVHGPSLLSTSAVSSHPASMQSEVEHIESEEPPIASAEQQLIPSSNEESKLPDEGSMNNNQTQPPLEENPPSRERSCSISASSSSSRPVSPVDKDSSEPVQPSASLLEKDDNTARVLDELPSLRPSEEAGNDDDVQGVKVERLSVSSVSADEDVVGSKSLTGDVAVADMGETSLKDLEISDDEEMSEEDEDEEEGETNENEGEGAVLSKSSSSLVEGEKDSSFQEVEPAAPIGGKKMIKKEISLSPVSSPGSEFDAEPKLGGEDEGEFSTQDALQGQEETELGVDIKKEHFDSPENFQTLSSEDDEETKVTTDQPVASNIQSELTKDQVRNDDLVHVEQKLVSEAKVKVQVLDSASVQYGDDNVQDMGTVEEVLEVLEQKLSSDEESEESDEGEEEEGEVQKEGVGGEEGVASEVGLVSGEGVMVEEEEEDMVETLSAMVPTPRATVTTESV